MFGLKPDWVLDPPPYYFTLEDYEGGEPRWCPGCGDFAILTAAQRVCREEQLPREKTVFVSGIGCSSRFPHYMHTYGFHGLHGRALPVAMGVKSRRPDLHVWVATGDGDCCSIGAAHWVHAIRYNMDITVMLFDNAIYGLTKKQTSPTTPKGFKTNTHPRGALLEPIHPLTATLGLTNLSYLAQTVDWNPIHLYETLHSAFKHKGLSFVRILQRCPTYSTLFDHHQQDTSGLLLLEHENGIPVDDTLKRVFKNRATHDPTDKAAAHALVEQEDYIPLGLIYKDESRPRYDDMTREGLEMTLEEKMENLERELDRFAVIS